MAMDPLSDMLSLLRPRSYMFGGLDIGGDWSFHVADPSGLKCYALLSGACWLAVEGIGEFRLIEGDCFVLPRGRPFRLASDLTVPSMDAEDAFGQPFDGTILTVNGGGGCMGIGGHFDLAGWPADELLQILPPVILIDRQEDRETLRWLVQRMMEELRTPRPGGHLLAEHLSHMLLIQAIRLHFAGDPSQASGWLAALADRRIGAALTAIHRDPARPWTVGSLAEHAGMSRTSFAVLFRRLVDKAPLEYLTRWRMLKAADLLRQPGAVVAKVAHAVGYQSESAFSISFKRVLGSSPRQFVRQRGIGLGTALAAVPASPKKPAAYPWPSHSA